LKFRIVYTYRAIKDIEKLDPATRHRIEKALLRFEEDPLVHAEKLIDSRLGTYRFRLGS
jgi:mRNA interferase RelE/StbE